ncbi:MAG TPA: DUF5691 domain-containing protein [Actinomycetes bacterium]|nr:DUF5691 domain-containing protein [Actinomycetes bacterium]
MTAVDPWQELLATALLGTARRPLPPAGTTAGDRLGSLLADLAEARGPVGVPGGRDVEGLLLSAAAAVALHRRAGRRPAVDPGPPPEPCPPDEAPPCGRVAAGHLALVLRGGYGDLLPEWLDALAAAGRRLPEEHLPALLDLARDRPELRAAVDPVLGRRGRWLAAQNPAWSWALDADPEAAWRSGGRAERLALLDALRATSPDAARALVETTWDEEGAELRAAMVERLHAGLAMADEPFLEAALDDPAGGVRRAAAALLACLPGSRLCARMTGRALPLLRLGPGPRPRLEATLPTEVDAGMARDGVVPLRRSGVGERAGWLLQLVAAVPPDAWCERLGRDPAELLTLAARDGTDAFGAAATLGAVVLGGWATAASRQRDSAWAGALLEGWWATPAGRPGDTPWAAVLLAAPALPGPVFAGLVAALPPEQREALALRLLRDTDSAGAPEPVVLSVLRACRRPLSGRLGRAVLAHVGRTATASPYAAHHRSSLDELARILPAGLAGDAAAALGRARHEAPRARAAALDRFLDVLTLRRDIHRDIHEGDRP